ncbi:unnamed protein product, partial [Effrenium voratum]
RALSSVCGSPRCPTNESKGGQRFFERPWATALATCRRAVRNDRPPAAVGARLVRPPMAKLEDRMEQVLERHRLEMMRHLDAWLESVEQSLGPQVRPMPSTPTRQKRPSLRSAPTRGEGLSDRMNSYDAARLTHTRVVEA